MLAFSNTFYRVECAASSCEGASMRHMDEDEWLWGWDPTPGIVSVWAERNGRAVLWRRAPGGALIREEERFHPWLLLPALDDLAYLGARLLPEGAVGTELPGVVAWRELSWRWATFAIW